MLLCLVTLTDLQTRRAGLSASAELLVNMWLGRGRCADYTRCQIIFWSNAPFFLQGAKYCLLATEKM